MPTVSIDPDPESDKGQTLDIKTSQDQNIEQNEEVNLEHHHLSSEYDSTDTEDLADSTATSGEDQGSSKTVPSYESLDSEGLAPSEPTSEPDQSKRVKGNKKRGLSARMEYLARPKKDFLDKVMFERLDGALPEKPLPSWSILPLPTKLPAGQYPYKITLTKIADNLFLPPSGNKMDLFDNYNRHLPMKYYESLHDPCLKHHFHKDKLRRHLEKQGYVTKSGNVVCTLKDINDYRDYQRRILAEKALQLYRDQDKEDKIEMERKFKEKIAQEEERIKNKRLQTNLRSFIKNQVQNIREGSVIAQRERDRKVLNRQISMQLKWRKRALMKQERYDRLFFKHMNDKYERDEKNKQKEIELARRDMMHMNDICRERELEKKERKKKLEEFWERKVTEQIAWVEKGFELERAWLEEREANINRRKNRAIPPLRKAKKPEAGKKTLEEALKDEVETDLQKDEDETILETDEGQQASTLDSKSTLDSPRVQIITEKPEEASSVQEAEVTLKLGSEKNQIEEDSENPKSILKKDSKQDDSKKDDSQNDDSKKMIPKKMIQKQMRLNRMILTKNESYAKFKARKYKNQ
ncbi:uncharacterized protein CDAR_120111 [Caerostris darwini]|uniref:Fibrous sheath-interacting protein 2 n=1 Tax=Caerostris darwini TaxID=1538125 RepID=A0AAV4NHW1_9ARAC|nr:uncharacterized protein CDAR_120111 [Caerostris darwini]